MNILLAFAHSTASWSSQRKKNYAGSAENHRPQLRKRGHFGTVKLLERKNQWGSRVLQAWPETGFW
jgi:hypothetical protein